MRRGWLRQPRLCRHAAVHGEGNRGAERAGGARQHPAHVLLCPYLDVRSAALGVSAMGAGSAMPKTAQVAESSKP